MPYHAPLTAATEPQGRSGAGSIQNTAFSHATTVAGSLVLSAEGARPDSGILWVSTRSSSDSPAGKLRAFDPFSLRQLWSADTPAWSKFTPPTVARGRVFLPATSPAQSAQQVMVYGVK